MLYSNGQSGGEVLSLTDWKKWLAFGAVTPDDGIGYFADANYYNTDYSVWGGIRPEGLNYVVWFNK